jgi:hypothetical protein
LSKNRLFFGVKKQSQLNIGFFPFLCAGLNYNINSMKIFSIWSISLLLLFCILSSQCTGGKNSGHTNKNSTTTGFDPQNDILVRIDPSTGAYTIAIKENTLKESLKLADLALEEVLEIFVQRSDEEHAYLVFHARDTSGNSVKKAVYLRQLTKGIFKAETTTREPVSHVCEGACCLDCNFRVKNNKFHGCDCQNQCEAADKDAPGYCNHSIGQSATMILAPL